MKTKPETTATDSATPRGRLDSSVRQPPIKAKYEGFCAAQAGIKVGDNPYPENCNDHWLWITGWVTRKELIQTTQISAELNGHLIHHDKT